MDPVPPLVPVSQVNIRMENMKIHCKLETTTCISLNVKTIIIFRDGRLKSVSS